MVMVVVVVEAVEAVQIQMVQPKVVVKVLVILQSLRG